MMEIYDDGDKAGSLKGFTWSVILSQMLGLTLVIMLAVWLGHYRGGFAWQSNLHLEFNYHPLFMVIGFILIYGNAIMSFRVFRNSQKFCIKVLHSGMQILALIFAIVGLKAVFDTHNLPTKPIANVYSLHSWLGLATTILFALQWFIGFVSFMWPNIRYQWKDKLMPFHTYFGMGILVMAMLSCLTGLTEKAFFALEDYATNYEGKLINSLGLVLVAFVALVIYIVSRSEWKRYPSPEERHIQLSE